ncbi:PstS family phosphate ABC transporter substrate-binding protein [cf. Phormidesmis sp. LEGE 11477]|uniref:PstS family phosphate ABC transporter substrate-binding protein n=1 Tax=cf. Phormidesmis sp. LEGE 11477 TaxID=1828680 RepID=UPI0018824903|nr:PstS family phosphate ABC transporter substrate-binding protein [cf. Phormidesmis sp. LEGE 11477]MBE9062752.1 PstS family phosphate ABC transporter substrate-binding protein [cf. Phormidesmis sp. LEGE 11477]
MSQPKSEVPALVVTLVVMVAILGGAFWFLKDRVSLGGLSGGSQPSDQTASSNQSGANQPIQGNAGTSAPMDFGGVTDVPTGQFRYGGSTAWAPIRGVASPVIQSSFPGFSLLYTESPNQAPGSGVGIQMLINGELSFAQSSRPITASERQQATQQGITLQEIPVAMEAVAVATHPNLPLAGLTLAQLAGVYTGEITNWQQVGGPNLAVVPVSRSEQGGTVQYFQEAVLEGQPLSSTVQNQSTTTAAIRFVSDTPGAIYYASAPELVGQCTVAPLPIGADPRELIPPYQSPYVPPQNCPAQRNQLNLQAIQDQSYPLTRPIFVIVRQGDPVSENPGTAYAQLLKTDSGKRLLNEAGFVAVQ